MKKPNRRQRRGRPRRRNSQKRSARSSQPISSIITDYVSNAGVMPKAHIRALRAAVPRDAPLHASGWFTDGVARARSATKLSAFEVAGLLDGFLRWCHRCHLVPDEHVALQLAQIELLRRRSGETPDVIELPEPRSPSGRTTQDLAHFVAYWEGMSYGAALTQECYDENAAMLLVTGAIELARHLAEFDGVPIRLNHLDPAALAFALEAERPAQDLPPRPERYTPAVLEGVAFFYERCAEHGWVAVDVAEDLALQLRSLARISEHLDPTAAALAN